ncbi:hypothetical protein EYF80_008958 [Liparis tanakae]|uniref:Uncharacterized protein n=1 Tax=Liparis tanakae TaxID=230148 RepID=A0A4Z2IT82_9TELE|nr:hypothetical protein EYF80_008958 [Liparis tanakae]
MDSCMALLDGAGSYEISQQIIAPPDLPLARLLAMTKHKGAAMTVESCRYVLSPTNGSPSTP